MPSECEGVSRDASSPFVARVHDRAICYGLCRWHQNGGRCMRRTELASPPLAGGTAYVSRPELGKSSRAAAPASCACHTLSASVQPACVLPSSEAPGCTRAHQAIISGRHSAHSMWLCSEERLPGEGGGGHMLGMQEQPSAGCNAQHA